MTDDDIFRLVLTAGITILLPIAPYYRIRSQAAGEKLRRAGSASNRVKHFG